MSHDDAILIYQGMIIATMLNGIFCISAAFFIRSKAQQLFDDWKMLNGRL